MKYKRTTKQIKSSKRNFMIMYFIGVRTLIRKFYPMCRYWKCKLLLRGIDAAICNLLDELQSENCKTNYLHYFNPDNDGSSKSSK